MQLTGPAIAPFDRTLPLTADGTVFAVPTPGHMPGHLSVVVRAPEVAYFLAADATYDDQLLTDRIVDGLSANLTVALDTLDRIAAFARSEPTVPCPLKILWQSTASPNASHLTADEQTAARIPSRATS